jgi:hypothetical protein
VDHPPYSPDLAPADFWLFPKLESLLERKRFSDVEDIKSSGKKMLAFLLRILKIVLNNGRSAGNIVKNWREIALKMSRLLIYVQLLKYIKKF